ncbi:Imm10 family immunity protein [Sorangium sp. So ce887]|uniref:Imm10 family immunity protein n=1 Tax=Sorangium sp. So ce887 TaxID=3133324 RepID=UPI003F622FD2
MRRFEARTLASGEHPDINTFVVILAEHADGSGARLEIQKPLSSDEQDRRLGLDTYCLCTEEGATHYGGVMSWTLTQSSLKILLDAKAAEALGVEGGFVVDFAPESRMVARVGLRGGVDHRPTARA